MNGFMNIYLNTLVLLRARVCEQFLEPNEYNPLGYFENETISYQINEALLNHFGGSWDNPPLLEDGWELSFIRANC